MFGGISFLWLFFYSRIVNAREGKCYIREEVIMYEKIKKYRKACIWGFSVISLLILPLTVDAVQVSETAKQKLRTRVSHSCIDSPIETVLMDLADQANIDIIKGPNVVDNVTFKVTDVPLEEALAHILAAYGYTYITTENMVRVLQLPEMSELKEELVTKIYKITYADANQVFFALDEFISGKGEVAINKGTSHIMVTDTEDKIKAIEKFIERVDRITQQVLVEVRIYDVTTKEGFELDPQWHFGRNAPYTPGTFQSPREITETVIGPESSNYTEFRKEVQWADPTDYPGPPNIFVDQGRNFTYYERTEEQSTTEPGRTETETRYIDYGKIGDRRRKPFVGGSFDRIEGGNLSVSVLNDAIDLDFVLSILHNQLDARLLANPRILVLDNETANFRIVREIPYREFRQIGREDPIDFTAFKDVGVKLNVTPHIARDQLLRLEVEPEFSVLVSRDELGIPTVDKRRANTITMVRDGQTVAIGGLRRREITKDIAKVPVLGDMPFVGGLFISETESKVVNELIVFITTRIITEPTLSESEKKLLNKTGFTTPVFEKTRIEKGELEIEKAEAGKEGITESLDLLLKKLGPSSE
jgi:type IV pilus assembly protein PilQ